MDKQRFLVGLTDIEKYRVLMDCLEKKIKATQASQVLGLSYIHTLRLKKKAAHSVTRRLPRNYLTTVIALAIELPPLVTL